MHLTTKFVLENRHTRKRPELYRIIKKTNFISICENVNNNLKKQDCKNPLIFKNKVMSLFLIQMVAVGSYSLDNFLAKAIIQLQVQPIKLWEKNEHNIIYLVKVVTGNLYFKTRLFIFIKIVFITKLCVLSLLLCGMPHLSQSTRARAHTHGVYGWMERNQGIKQFIFPHFYFALVSVLQLSSQIVEVKGIK